MIKKVLLVIFILIIVIFGGWALMYNFQKSSQDNVVYKTTKAFRTDITKTSVATGEIKPKETIEIKPNISGVIDKILVEEGDEVESGQLIATIKVIPDVNSLNNANQQIRSAEIDLQNQTRNYNRQKTLFDQGVISKAEYENALATYNLAQQSLRTARNNYQVAQSGVAPGLERYANTQIRSTTKGMVLDIPVELGNTVQELSNFSVGTTIATVADINQMVFEGMVDEADVGKLEVGMPLKITVGALPDKSFDGILDFISPSGVEENGVVQFEIKATVTLSKDAFIRAGYSANAEIITQNLKNVLAIREADLQYDDKGKAFVEVKKGEEWEKKFVRLGTSDGVNVAIESGISESDEIKVWNTDLTEEGENAEKPESEES